MMRWSVREMPIGDNARHAHGNMRTKGMAIRNRFTEFLFGEELCVDR